MRKVITSYVKDNSNVTHSQFPKEPFVEHVNVEKVILEKPLNKTLQHTETSTKGFVDAFEIAYKTSSPLELRPDMFFIVIMQSLSKHIEKNVEKYRNLFTDSKEKQLLFKEVELDDYQAFIDSIGEQLREKIKFDPSVKFSTSTQISTTVNDVTLMNVCKEYYNYMMLTNCVEISAPKEGITEFHVYGTIDDWNQLINKVNYIGTTFELRFWTDYVTKVLTYIRDCNYNDKAFWDNAYKYKGSATGWFLAFFLYTKDGKLTSWKRIGDYFGGSYPDQITTTPFVYIRLAEKKDMELLSGLCGVYKDNVTGAISPCIGWAYGTKKSRELSREEEGDIWRHRKDAKYLNDHYYSS